jgi:hypothetical protein
MFHPAAAWSFIKHREQSWRNMAGMTSELGDPSSPWTVSATQMLYWRRSAGLTAGSHMGEQDILIHCLSLDRARPRDKQWSWGPGAVLEGKASARKQLNMTAGGTLRRRSRQAVPRPRVVQFSLTEEEFEDVRRAAARSGQARGAFAAEATLASARGLSARTSSPLREALVEVMAAAGLVRRIGTNLNQAVARLNATGQRGEDLIPAAQFCVRVIRRLDEAAEQLRRSVP